MKRYKRSESRLRSGESTLWILVTTFALGLLWSALHGCGEGMTPDTPDASTPDAAPCGQLYQPCCTGLGDSGAWCEPPNTCAASAPICDEP